MGERRDISDVFHVISMRTLDVGVAVLTAQRFFPFVVRQDRFDASIKGAQISEGALEQSERPFARGVEHWRKTLLRRRSEFSIWIIGEHCVKYNKCFILFSVGGTKAWHGFKSERTHSAVRAPG